MPGLRSPTWGDIKTRMVVGSFVANLGGACFVFVYLEFIAPFQPTWQPSTVVLDAGLAIVAVVVAALVHERVIGCQYHKATAWIHEKRPPTEAERRGTLTLPWRSTAISVVSWVIAAIGFGVLVRFQDASVLFSAEVDITTVLGGLVTTALAYLLMERAVAPLTPLTLQNESPVRSASLGIRPRLILAWALGSGIPLLALSFLALDARAAEVNGATAAPSISGAVIAISLTATLVGLVLTVAVARSVAEPMDHLREGLRQVERGHFDTVVDVEDGGEIGLLQSGFNRMVAGLAERERLHDLFGRHVGVQVAQRALEEGSGLGGEQHAVSALFVDLVGSTALAEVLPPGEVVATLNAFFGAVVAVVNTEGGWVNKFEGDGALCVFGAPGL
ncbi:MAG: adenylate/guanylate cyclase domain-containing protein, partial [Actinomycetota bacterium]|nr:adenylate/guanylate cyclase domain-containing protein [Actinomycetota bacterium]